MTTETAGPGHNSVAGERLKSFIERIERLEEEKANIGADIKDVYAEAKGAGFDAKTIRKIISLRKMDAAKREEEQALLDIYMAALGMLADTPLGEAARKRLTRDKPVPAPAPVDSKPFLPGASEGDARAMGADAAREGKAVTANPFPAGDKRRAAWDEAWCAETGSDGMDIPETWRRKKPAKPADDSEPEKPAKKTGGKGGKK